MNILIDISEENLKKNHRCASTDRFLPFAVESLEGNSGTLGIPLRLPFTQTEEEDTSSSSSSSSSSGMVIVVLVLVGWLVAATSAVASVGSGSGGDVSCCPWVTDENFPDRNVAATSTNQEEPEQQKREQHRREGSTSNGVSSNEHQHQYQQQQWIGLSLLLQPFHYINGQLNLRCTAQIPGIYSAMNEIQLGAGLREPVPERDHEKEEEEEDDEDEDEDEEEVQERRNTINNNGTLVKKRKNTEKIIRKFFEKAYLLQ
ncbi:hypothetical protein M0804_009737 [Polistes exclamans]|nr:hypothetical protein M0804_009737 [Polistes exclamans]